MNIAAWLNRAGLSHPGLPAVGYGSRVTQSYGALAERAARLANALHGAWAQARRPRRDRREELRRVCRDHPRHLARRLRGGAGQRQAARARAWLHPRAEACGNVVRHAYGDDPGDVFVSYVVRDGALEILVEDQGKGLEGRDASTGAMPAPADGGMGMAIIRTIVDELAIDAGADGRGTVIRMTKRLAPGPVL